MRNKSWRLFCLPRALQAIALLALVGVADRSFALADSQRVQAAQKTVGANAACTALPNFYWEIGDRKGALASGTRGMLPPAADAQIAIYSAGKWLYGAYVYQQRFGVLTNADMQALTMRSGYRDNGQCTLQSTVGACQSTVGKLDASAVGQFSYGPGHFQKHASIDLGLKNVTGAQLASEIVRGLGGGLALTYNQPQIAGGARSSAKDYAVFLRRILSGQLMAGGLGPSAVCTYTGASSTATGRTRCAASLYSPASDPAAGLQEAWHYSIGHWVEDDPVTGDGAFSSPGAGGFYPWIDASKTYYGVLSRLQVTATASAESVKCGRLIRKAWISGTAQ